MLIVFLGNESLYDTNKWFKGKTNLFVLNSRQSASQDAIDSIC